MSVTKIFQHLRQSFKNAAAVFVLEICQSSRYERDQRAHLSTDRLFERGFQVHLPSIQLRVFRHDVASGASAFRPEYFRQCKGVLLVRGNLYHELRVECFKVRKLFQEPRPLLGFGNNFEKAFLPVCRYERLNQCLFVIDRCGHSRILTDCRCKQAITLITPPMSAMGILQQAIAARPRRVRYVATLCNAP